LQTLKNPMNMKIAKYVSFSTTTYFLLSWVEVPIEYHFSLKIFTKYSIKSRPARSNRRIAWGRAFFSPTNDKKTQWTI